jgi:tetratricopeptide (TPR) repeat protein
MVPAAVLLAVLAGGRASAQNAGQAELDKATQRKIEAITMADLSEVIRLCEQAQKKGLSKGNAAFAKNLLTASLVQRGSVFATKVFHEIPNDPDWLKDRSAALADLERGLKLDAQQPQALFLLARLLFLPDGDVKRAAKALDDTIALSGDDPPMLSEALVLRASLERDPVRRQGDLDRAIQVAPANASALRARGLNRAEMDKFDAALDDFDKAIALDPRQISTYQYKVQVLVKQRKLKEAVAVLDRAERFLPKNVDLITLKAQILQAEGDARAALAELDRAVAQDPGNLRVRHMRAAWRHEMGDEAGTLADLEKLLAANPNQPGLQQDRVKLLAALGRLAEATAAGEQLHKANPRDGSMTLLLGRLYTAQKQYQKAADAYTEVLADHPEAWTAHRDRGNVFLSLGRQAEAIADYDRAMQSRPKDVEILNNLAWALATAPEDKLRDGKRAVILAEEACRQTGYKADYILSTLAAAYAESGDFDAAQRWAAKAVDEATKAHREELKKELASYQAHKPWREAEPISEAPAAGKKPPVKTPPAKKAEATPAATKPEAKKPEAEKTEKK